MTPLLPLVLRRIRQTGPISLATYMAEALLHPEHGYYSQREPFGRAGDFVTAPEVSQIFGELLGLWCVDCWQRLGAPDPVLLVELGPGRGTLMADALRAAGVMPGFRAAAQVHLVEASARLVRRQQETLEGTAATWHDGLESLPEGPLLLLANEFFDALPIRQFERRPAGWAEQLVTLSEDGKGLAFGLAPPSPLNDLLGLPPAEVGQRAEIRPAAAAIAGQIGARLARHGGAALLIDYGYVGPRVGDSLQALQQGRPADPLAAPGTADLTAHVDFGTLATAARDAGATVYGPVTQAELLFALGIRPRAEALGRQADPSQARALAAAVERLTSPAQMGRLFKALALTSGSDSIPAGFGMQAPPRRG